METRIAILPERLWVELVHNFCLQLPGPEYGEENVYSTGITLYHLKSGDTTIGGNENCDIALKGTSIEEAI